MDIKQPNLWKFELSAVQVMRKLCEKHSQETVGEKNSFGNFFKMCIFLVFFSEIRALRTDTFVSQVKLAFI